MESHKKLVGAFLVLSILIISCHNNAGKPAAKEIVSNPEQMDQKVSDGIKDAIQYSLENKGKVDDSITLKMDSVVSYFYDKNNYTNVWSHTEKWDPLADSLYDFIEHAELSGLFPNDYHFKHLMSLRNRLKDSVQRTDAALWTRADLMLTDGFMRIVKDLKCGRLPDDSISLDKDSMINNDFYSSNLQSLVDKKQLTDLFTSLEPVHKGYWDLKNGIQNFLDSMDRRVYTHVVYPYKSKSPKDSVAFVATLQKRLNEAGCIDFTDKTPDTLQLKQAIKKYQKLKGIKQDGLVSSSLIKTLNNTDVEKFRRIAITLDRYKKLPPQMPDRYIWVNLPEYYLQVWDHDTLAFNSKVVCGKPTTKTPQLNSAITNMVTYPTWTVPTSIIAKEILPGLKKNPYYLTKKGLHLEDKDGETVDPNSVKWSKYTKGIPYKVVQGSGDDNALGIFKFNFNNKYAVYLHDTNERHLFGRTVRDLSHGCVRVQEWQKLAFYIVQYDSLNAKPNTKIITTDSVLSLLAKKEKKTIEVKNRLPLFIRYYTCEGVDGRIKFYDDMYGEDEMIRNKYFSDK